jgi:anti-anti-sigma factor
MAPEITLLFLRGRGGSGYTVRAAVLRTLATPPSMLRARRLAMAIATPPSLGHVGPAPSAWPEGVRIVIWISGEQDASTAVRLAERLERACGLGTGPVVIDLSRVEFMDAGIVRVLVHCADRLRQESRELKLRAPSPVARRVLDLCGLAELCATASVGRR